MKKILSTFVMCVILGVGSVWAVDATLNITIKTVVRTSPTDPNGEVVANVCTQEIVDGETVVDCAGTKSGYNLIASLDVPADQRYYTTSDLALDKARSEFNDDRITVSGQCDLSSECSEGNYIFSHWEANDASVKISNSGLGPVGQCRFTIEIKKGTLFTLNKASTYSEGSGLGKKKYIKFSLSPNSGVTQTITLYARWEKRI